MDESTTPRRPSRRTLAKGAAWSVPAIAVTAPVASAATSPPPPPPPPDVSWAGACASVGNGQGCSGQQFALQVPVTLENPTAQDLLFVVEAGFSANSNVTPTPPAMMPPPGGPGSGLGFYGLGSDADDCTILAPPAQCPAITPIASPTSKVLVLAGQTRVLWYAFNGTGNNASSFVGKIWYTWYDPITCLEIGVGGDTQTSQAISPANCNNFANPT